MNPLVEVQLVTRRELRQSFRSVKGVVLAGLTVGGGAAVSMLLAWMDRLQRENVPEGVDLRPAREQFFEHLYAADTAQVLADCPYPLWVMLIVTLWLGPLFIALMDFDAISGELQYRTVRYFTPRIRRAPYVVGKALGAWAVVLAVTFGMNAIVWAFTASVGHLPLSYVLGWGLRFFAVSVPISAAWCGIATLVGSQFKTPMLSLLVTCAVFFAIWLLWLVSGFTHTEALAYIDPNVYDRLLLSPHASDTGKGLLGSAGIAAATTAAAAFLFQQRDV